MRRIPTFAAFVVLSGCDPPDGNLPSDASAEASCDGDAASGLSLGPFGLSAEPLNAGATLPVWVPLQGGVVVGVNVLATGVPAAANKLVITVTNPMNGSQIGLLSYRAAHFLCDSGVRVWRRGMVPLNTEISSSSAQYDDMVVVVEVEARFPLADGTLRELSHTQIIGLEDEPPNRF